VFGPGRAAATEIAHMGCQLWQVDDKPTFDLMVNRSLSKSLWSWLAASAAAYGYEVVA
jgi:sarcosine oxidase subunit gamma